MDKDNEIIIKALADYERGAIQDYIDFSAIAGLTEFFSEVTDQAQTQDFDELSRIFAKEAPRRGYGDDALTLIDRKLARLKVFTETISKYNPS